MKPDKTKRADIVYINHTCDICHQTKDEPYELYDRNNPRHLQKFTSVCNYCTRKKLLQSEWVSMKARAYDGLLGPIGRAWVEIRAGLEFERIWSSTGEFGVKVKMGRFKGVEVPRSVDLEDFGSKTNSWQQDCRDEIKKESVMGKQIIDSAALLSLIIEATHGSNKQAFLQGLPSEGFGDYKIIWDGNLIKIVLEKFKRARYYIDNVEVDSLQIDAILERTQRFGVFHSTCLVEFNGIWTLKAQFNNDLLLSAPGEPTQIIVTSPSADSLVGAQWTTKNQYQEALDIIKDAPQAPCGGKAPGSPDVAYDGNPESPEDLPAGMAMDLGHGQDIGALSALITTGIDRAGGRDYSVLMEYRRAGDLATATVQIDVSSVQVINQSKEDLVGVPDDFMAEVKAAEPELKRPVEEVVEIKTGPSTILDVDHSIDSAAQSWISSDALVAAVETGGECLGVGDDVIGRVPRGLLAGMIDYGIAGKVLEPWMVDKLRELLYPNLVEGQ